MTGFRKSHTAKHCLVSKFEMWKNILDHRGYICAISMNLLKAFVTLKSDLFIANLEVYEFETDTLQYMKSYLTTRK